MKPFVYIIALSHLAILNVSNVSSQPIVKAQNNRYDTLGEVPGDYRNGFSSLKNLYDSIIIYKSRHNGIYPENFGVMFSDISRFPLSYGGKGAPEVTSRFKNPDSLFSDNATARKRPDKMNEFFLMGERPKGGPLDGPKPRYTEDVIAYSSTYHHKNFKATEDGFDYNPVGYLLVLRGDGEIEKINYDQVFFFPYNSPKSHYIFPNQPGVPFDVLTYDEYYTGTTTTPAPRGKPVRDGGSDSVVDNGGPESLIQLSRILAWPDRYGISREYLWERFDSAQAEFTLQDIQSGAEALGITTQVESLPLSKLKKSGAPALLFLQDDGRIVTLAAVDDDRAIIVDRGLTQNVERNVLEKRYSGEALVVTKALTQNAAIASDDGVREVKLPSLDAEVPQQFVLRNTGATPITLQLEYPLLGVTESKLSKDVIAPGETATLDLKVKWRSILKAPYQNVLVSIQTNDPIVPRLQLAVLLTPPATADTK